MRMTQMVARLNNIISQRFTRRKIWHARSGLVALVAALVFLTYDAQSQNFVNGSTGTYKGPGLFQVKGHATGLPDTVTGTFEYFGTDSQRVEAKNFEHLLLSGKGSIKQTLSNVNILNSVAVADGVRFEVISSTMTLEKITGRITNEDGFIAGKIKATVDLNAPSDTTDFGGIGMAIRSVGSAPGTTDVIRTSGSTPGGRNSIRRWYETNPANTNGFGGKLYFHFAKDELAGQDSTTLDVWRSPDNGATWRRQRTMRNGRTLSLTSSALRGQWTAADANNLLGRANYEFDPDSLSIATPKYMTGRIGRTLDPSTVKVTDVYGNPITNATINFEVNNPLAGSLTILSAPTDSLGKVSTQLQVGSKRGRFGIIAKVASVPIAVDTFWVDVIGGVVALPIIAGNNQADTVKKTLQPIQIAAQDDSLFAVPGTEVHFQIVDAPLHTMGARLTDTVTTTGSNGIASTTILLGNKAGEYRVKVSSPETDSVTYVTVKARHGVPALTWQNSIPMNPDTIESTAARFTYAITDIDTNIVGNHAITWAISGKPSGATGDSLINPIVRTDTITGESSVAFRLGDKIGPYIVSAEDPSVQNSKRSFTVNAKHGKITKINPFIPSGSDTIGASIHFGMNLADRKDNPANDEIVRFSLGNRPDSLLTNVIADSVVTDSIGRASMRLTLGNRVGSYRVDASFASLPSVTQTFIFTARPGVPQKFFAQRGCLYQTKPILQQLNVPLVIRLSDRANNPIQFDTVHFAITGKPSSATGDSLSQTMAMTDINGFASTQLTLGDKIGDYTVIATSSRLGIQPIFTATAISGSARILAYDKGNNQNKQILTVLDTALVVRVTDAGGNPVPGTTVKFAIVDMPSGAWGQRLGHDTVWTSSIDSVKSNSLGFASMYLKFGSRTGEYRIIATSPTLSDTTRFVARARVGLPKTLAQYSGNAQVGQLGERMLPFVVQVSDTGGNLVPGVKVSFTTITPDTITKYDSLTTHVGPTDSAGQVSTSLTLGNRPGRYTVQASIAGVKDTSFVAYAIMLYSDVNNDNYLNIGDLTAIIDHIIGRKILTGYNFIKADLYPKRPDGTVGDGNVNISDLQYCLDSLLTAGWDPTHDWLNAQELLPMLLKTERTAPFSSVSTPIQMSATDSCYIQTTHIGSRFMLKNSEAVRGLQVKIYMKEPVNLTAADIVFSRAKMMNTNVKSIGKELNIILWNTANAPIDSGDADIFRLPIQLTDNNIDSVRVLTSDANNVVTMVQSAQVDMRNMIPREWMLYQNYPNPFNPSTTIEFDVPEVTSKIPRVAIQIFNILGQKVATIERGIHDAGRYSIRWEGKNENGVRVASGVYFYRLLAGDYVSTKKMVMIK
jgi:hypothetical protein